MQEKFQALRLLSSLKTSMNINIRNNLISSLAGSLTALIGSLGPLIVLWYGGNEVIRGRLTIGQLIGFNSFLAYLFGPTQRLVNLNFSVQHSLGAIERIFEILDFEPEVKEDSDAQELKSINGFITFENLNFSYNGTDWVLKNINFTINAGEVVAIVGKSGAGKSTLAKLIPRFYDPQLGSIKIDGVDIRKVTIKSLREQIGVVSQETFLFSGSVKENIRYGNSRASDEDIIKAAKAANAHEFIVRLPQSYDTEIGERGIKISGGQKQRLAIARMILKNPKILVMDEATSSVDSKSEKLIQEALCNLMKGRTTIVIAHRLSTILFADMIVILENGQIVEQGTHKELYEKSSVYRRLFDNQFTL